MSDISYYYCKNCFIYKMYADKSKGEYRDNNGAWTTRPYREQVDNIPAYEMREISKEEANKICRKWHEKAPFDTTVARDYL